MKVTLLAAGLVATVFAQDLSSIPECARSCLTDAIAQDGQCQATDASCVCGRIDQLTTLATGCVLSACGQDVALSMRSPPSLLKKPSCVFCVPVTNITTSLSRPSPARRPDLLRQRRLRLRLLRRLRPSQHVRGLYHRI